LFLFRRCTPAYVFGTCARASAQGLIRVSATTQGLKRLRARFPVQVEAELETIAIEAIDSVVPVTRLRPGDEFDVDFMRVSLDVDVEDALIRRFRRFGSETVAVDQQPGCGQRDRGHGLAVNDQA